MFERGGYLMSEEPEDPPRHLRHLGEHRFVADNGVRVEFNIADGRATGFTAQVQERTVLGKRVR